MADIDRHSGMEKLRDMPQGSPEDVKMLGLFMDVGAMMIRNGSEVKRVEDTLRRMGAAYGAERMDVFAITSTLVCTMNMPDGSVCSMTRGTRDGTKTDFWKLERINALSREYCRQPLATEGLKERIEEIEQASAPRFRVCMGSVLAAGALAVFFGGTILDGAMAAAFAEAMRYHSLSITPRGMLSRAASVLRGKTLIVNLPGSPKAVKENLEYILPSLEHGVRIAAGLDGECARK